MIINYLRDYILISSILISFIPSINGQSQRTNAHLLGFWKGAFIKENSIQTIDITFFNQDDQLMSLQEMEDWYPVYGEFEIPVSIDSTQTIIFNTGLGKAKVRMDSNYNEISGQIENTNPTVYLHLKKSATPPTPAFTVEEVNIPSGNINLTGHLHKPIIYSKTAIILVTGRGCYPVSTKYNLYAKILRKYGVTILAYRKRGTGASTGDCNSATIEELAQDVVSVKSFLISEGEYENIGVIGSSAGGWVMAKALDYTPIDFLIGIVGPSTSVYDQQMQSIAYGIEEYELSDIARQEVMEYTGMMFNADAKVENYNRFMSLLSGAERNGWKELLDDTDIPSSIKGIDSLWVRNHNYDPGPSLEKYNQPLLYIYGERDWIVPYKENIERLKEIFSGERSKLLTTAVAHDAAHGTETKGQYVDLADNHSYYHFFRISSTPMIEIINFLRKHQFID
jgi:pimeloyl-ACP methyl ester carboxylesterase